MDRRYALGQPGLPVEATAPGLVYDEATGEVFVVTPDGERFSLADLVSIARQPVANTPFENQNSITIPLVAVAADTPYTAVFGSIPYDCYLTSAALIPSEDIVFRARSGPSDTDRVDSRRWTIQRLRGVRLGAERLPAGDPDAPEWEQSIATLATIIYDGDTGGPLDDDATPDVRHPGAGLADFGRTMWGGAAYPFGINGPVSLGLKAGDVIRFVTDRFVDPNNVGPAWHGTAYAPAVPAAALRLGYVPIVPTASQGLQFDGQIPVTEDAEPDGGRVILTGQGPDQIDPGGGGGPPTVYCFKWFKDFQGNDLKWGGDWPGWLDFATQLRSRGQSEANWACAHKELAACIDAQVIHWGPPYGEYDETTLSGIRYQCEGGSANEPLWAVAVLPAAPEVNVTIAGVAVLATASLLIADGLIPDRVEYEQEINYGGVPIVKRKTIVHPTGAGTRWEHDVPALSVPGAIVFDPELLPIPAIPYQHILSARAFSGSGARSNAKAEARMLAAIRTRGKHESGDGEVILVAVAPAVDSLLDKLDDYPQVKGPNMLACGMVIFPKQARMQAITLKVDIWDAWGKLVATKSAFWERPFGSSGGARNYAYDLSVGKIRNFDPVPGLRGVNWRCRASADVVYIPKNLITPRTVELTAADVADETSTIDDDQLHNHGVFEVPFPREFLVSIH